MTSQQCFTVILILISSNNKKVDILKSTQKGLWENVKDGISRPIGSREIQKTKVETDLLDTLCIYSCVFTAFFKNFNSHHNIWTEYLLDFCLKFNGYKGCAGKVPLCLCAYLHKCRHVTNFYMFLACTFDGTFQRTVISLCSFNGIFKQSFNLVPSKITIVVTL